MLGTAVLCSLNAEMYSQLLLYHTVVFLSFSFHIISACSKQPEEKMDSNCQRLIYHVSPCDVYLLDPVY